MCRRTKGRFVSINRIEGSRFSVLEKVSEDTGVQTVDLHSPVAEAQVDAADDRGDPGQDQEYWNDLALLSARDNIEIG